MGCEGNKIVTLFDKVGYKTLSLQVVTENGLLTCADTNGDTNQGEKKITDEQQT